MASTGQYIGEGAKRTFMAPVEGFKYIFGPNHADTSGVKEAQKRAFDTQDQLAAERAGYTGNFNPGMDAGFANDQQQNIDQLSAAAAGRVPSPAEIQLQQQSGVNAARQFGLAAALQGRNPGAALRSGRLGSLATQADTNVQAAVLRAQEQERGRNMLIQALHAARGDEQNLNAQDIDWRKALLSGQLGALGAGTTAAVGNANASAADAAASNQYKGQMFQGGAGALSMLSDERTKTDVKPADLDTLADSLKGFRFRYKDAENGDGERVGVMAQDAAKGGPAGKRMVNMGGDGKLRLDVGNAVGAALAMSAKALREAKKPLVSLAKAA